ncbi:alpha/beta hydrolase [Oceanobacillus rekensis]|uniref:alpha/beta hydrolase n=1 Tax=Oceanobacillus rekensis TaxID=937927 RepID=UPI000B432D79|nr:alpha/beta hydrolase [Oceanobacillus rekensis]
MKNRVNPELREIIEAFPPLDLDNYKATRQAAQDGLQAMEIPLDESVSINDEMILNSYDQSSVRVRIYDKKEKSGEALPVLLWIHGGGYVLGSPEEGDILCQRFVAEANCMVVSVDYRLAPEFPYPAGLEDCYAALQWVYENAGELGVDATRIGVAGQSAGGGITAALALLTRDRKGPEISFQMPLYPMINDHNNTPSSFEVTGNFVWNHDLNKKGWSMYLNGKDGTESVSEYAAPARATNLSGLPKTYICVGQLDPFRDETLDYVTRLCQAGVDVEFHLYPGVFHGFEAIAPDTAIGKQTVDEYVGAVKNGLHPVSLVENI